MSRPDRIAAAVAGALLCGACAMPAAAGEYVFYHENVMGTSLELRVRADGPDAARAAEGRALAEIDRLAKLLSRWDPSSAFRRWEATAGTPVDVAPEFLDVLKAADRWRAASGGAFDPRVQALAALWAAGEAAGRVPTAAEIDAARARMARPAWRLDEAAGTAEHLGDGPLTLDAIAKGAIVERAAAAALRGGPGVRGVLLNVGGDLRAEGDLTATIGIADPRADSETGAPVATIAVRGRSVATSGRSQRGYQIAGRWYSHVLDPRTGRPVERVVAATVVAEAGADADALATILNVLGPEAGVRLVDATPGAACLVLEADGTATRSARWGDVETPPLARAEAQEPAQEPKAKADDAETMPPPWDEFEMEVDFEINPPEGGDRGYRRPYVAVWVEDADGYPVRTLTLWLSQGGPGFSRWLPEMSRWYRSDKERRRVDKSDLAYTISRPTRQPGSYRVVWDGRDDHGRPVAPGTYTVFVEAAREHGTHQLIRKEVTIGAKPFSEELKGNVEIRSAGIEYRRKGPGE